MSRERENPTENDLLDWGPSQDLYAAGFLRGRRILLTGFERGTIAAMLAKFLIEFGKADVCLHARSESVLADGRHILDSDPAHTVVADFSSLKSIPPMLHSIERAFPEPIDTFIHVAGLTAYSPVAELTPNFRSELRNINVHAAEQIFAGLADGMVRRGRGWVCLFSSIHASFPFSGNLTYRQTKKDVELLAENIAFEHGPDGINANAIAPGWVVVRRHFDESHFSEMIRARNELIPSRRLAYPIDIAMAAAWLCSEASRFVNGVTLPIDGGQHLVLK